MAGCGCRVGTLTSPWPRETHNPPLLLVGNTISTHLSSLSLNRPPPMLLNRHINLLHQLNGLTQCCHNSLVMLDILKRQSPPLAILQPLLTHLVATNMEIPHLRRHPLKVLLFIDINPTQFRLISWLQILNLLNHIIPLSRKLGHSPPKILHQMQPNQPFTKPAQLTKQVCIRGKRQARKIDLAKLSIAFAISR